MHEYKVGDLVLLTMSSPGTVGIVYGMMKYQGRKFRVSKVVKLSPNGKYNNFGTYYELRGCTSDHGVAYAITGDWMQPMRELKRK